MLFPLLNLNRKFNVFIYGCENRRHSEKFLREQIFPLMLHKNTAEKFSFDDCEFTFAGFAQFNTSLFDHMVVSS